MGNPDNSKTPVFSSPPPNNAPSVGMPMYTQMPHLNEPWSVGLFDCFSDCGRFCISCWCPCITFGQVSEILDRGSSSCGVNGGLYFLIAALTACGCVYSCVYRTKMREMFKLQGGGCEDLLVHCCCEACALTQMYNELQNRGFDVSIGWHGNVERQTRGVAAMTMAPPTMHVGMNR